ncbi:MAG: tetratricopeptide repeat protein [Deltaproteobacteria bacterium]|nr:tetratricopeptide repeat protein [Deltaproteobacteria bacterium]
MDRSRSRLAVGFVLLTLLSITLAPSRGWAQSSTDEEARLLFEAGRAAFSSGRYEEALERFERAHQLSGRAELLYNVGVSADRLREDARALAAFRAYLEALPEAPQHEEVQARITILEREVEAARRAPEPEPLALPDVPPDPPQPPPLEPRPRVHDDTGASLAIAGGVIAGLGLVAAVTLGALALGENDALVRTCSPSCAPGASDGLTTLTLATDASIGVAVVGAALFAVGLAIELGQGEDEVSLTLAPARDGALLALRGRLP